MGILSSIGSILTSAVKVAVNFVANTVLGIGLEGAALTTWASTITHVGVVAVAVYIGVKILKATDKAVDNKLFDFIFIRDNDDRVYFTHKESIDQAGNAYIGDFVSIMDMEDMFSGPTLRQIEIMGQSS